MGWLKAAWEWLRRLPVARYLRPLWQGLLVQLVQQEGDRLQVQVQAAVREHGPAAVDRLVDGWQERMHRGVALLPLPAWVRDPLRRLIQEHGDILQERLKDAMRNGGPPAVDVAFDTAQAAFIERIRAL